MRDRAKIAYDVFRGDFRGALRVPPHWDALDLWIRDALTFAYAQGKIDGNGAFARARAAAPPEMLPRSPGGEVVVLCPVCQTEWKFDDHDNCPTCKLAPQGVN